MKSIKRLFLVLPILTLLVSSCSFETDNEAGSMEGMWHLVGVETLSTGTKEDLSNQLIFWSFQARLLVLEDKEGKHSWYLYRFRNDNSQLTLNSPYRYDRENGDHPLTKYETTMAVYGVKSLAPAFRIEKVDGRKMILNDGVVRLCFDKF